MDERSFTTLADEQLLFISASLETADDEGLLDIEHEGGIITITLHSGKQYVINKHAPSKQIWLSSPVSGAHHFSYDETMQNWCTQSGTSLEELVQQELYDKAQVPISF
jgi:frataxin